jgi:small ligand-binding sensory domain FIST
MLARMNIYRWNGHSFERAVGALTSIVAGGGNAVFGINANDSNKVYRLVGNGFAQVVGGNNTTSSLTA